MNTSLTLSAQGPLPALPASIAPAAEAYAANELPVGMQSLADVGKLFNRLLSRAALLLGHKTWQDEAELFALASACAALMHRKFAGLKPAEIALAIDKGAAGEYKAKAEDVVYVQLPAITSWLYAYQTTARHEAIKALRKAEESDVLALPAPVRDYAAEVVQLVTLADAGGLPPAPELDFGNVLYDWLKAIGAFRDGYWPAGTPDYGSIRVEETDALLSEPPSADVLERRRRAGFLDMLLTGQWPEGHPLARTVANACKKRVLREWAIQYAAEEADAAAILAGLIACYAPAKEAA